MFFSFLVSLTRANKIFFEISAKKGDFGKKIITGKRINFKNIKKKR
jgi:hypothetical protein